MSVDIPTKSDGTEKQMVYDIIKAASDEHNGDKMAVASALGFPAGWLVWAVKNPGGNLVLNFRRDEKGHKLINGLAKLREQFGGKLPDGLKQVDVVIATRGATSRGGAWGTIRAALDEHNDDLSAAAAALGFPDGWTVRAITNPSGNKVFRAKPPETGVDAFVGIRALFEYMGELPVGLQECMPGYETVMAEAGKLQSSANDEKMAKKEAPPPKKPAMDAGPREPSAADKVSSSRSVPSASEKSPKEPEKDPPPAGPPAKKPRQDTDQTRPCEAASPDEEIPTAACDNGRLATEAPPPPPKAPPPAHLLRAAAGAKALAAAETESSPTSSPPAEAKAVPEEIAEKTEETVKQANGQQERRRSCETSNAVSKGVWFKKFSEEYGIPFWRNLNTEEAIWELPVAVKDASVWWNVDL